MSDEHDIENAARSFEQVLGHELYYVRQKRAVPRDGKTGGDYENFHKFESLSAELAQARENESVLTKLGRTELARTGIKWGRAGIQRVGHVAQKVKYLYAQARGAGEQTEADTTEPAGKADTDPIEEIQTKLAKVREDLKEERENILDRAAGENLTGLALSGGGIRSATFNLGILQALADLGCLKHLDYLSTVSGGGYIGGWLTALINREHQSDLQASDGAAGEAEQAPKNNPIPPARPGPRQDDSAERLAIGRVEKRLRGGRGRPGEPAEDEAITFLRRYSNYLTPKTGVLSADTWSLVATYVRNVLLNLTILVAAIGAVLVAFRWFAAALGTYTAIDPWLLGGAFALAAFAAFPFGANLGALLIAARRAPEEEAKHQSDDQGHLLRWIVAPLFAAAVLISLWLPEAAAGRMQPTRLIGFWPEASAGLLQLNAWLAAQWKGLLWITWAAVANGASWSLAAFFAYARPDTPPQTGRTWGRLVATAFLSGLIGGALLWAIAETLRFASLNLEREAIVPLQLALGPPLMLIWLSLLAMIQTGMMGRRLNDGQREWLSRLGAWLMICGLGWLVLFGLALFGPLLFERLNDYLRIALTSGWLATVVSGVWASRGSEKAAARASMPRKLLVLIAPYLFIAGFVAAIAAGLNSGVDWTVEKFDGPLEPPPAATVPFDDAAPTQDGAGGSGQEFRVVLFEYLKHLSAGQNPLILFAWLLLLIGIALIQSRLIDINEFSMHRFYGNRLTRCFLGASVDPRRRRKRVQRFTGFNREDDLALAGCEAKEKDERNREGIRRLIVDQPGPYPIVNTAINLVAGAELAWQQRMAASFIMSPLYCGFKPSATAKEKNEPATSKNKKSKPKVYPNGYQPTLRFASEPQELSLGVAMTTSGAAASPNMGYHSSPALAFLLTVFNVRLGRWVGNPRRPGLWRHSGPKYSGKLLRSELFALTRSDTEYVYLSDGGHFENLGIYELVKRRCRFIIACDAGADPEYKFEDLGNAIRKCRVDLGVDIRIGVDRIRERSQQGYSRWHCAMGDICYSDDDQGGTRGHLLYIKSSLTGDEPEDVINYAKDHSAFPHETTGDQFFDEAQFESYRRLGEHVGSEVFSCCKSAGDEEINVEESFVILGHRWYPPLPESGRFTQLTKRMGELFDELRKGENLAYLDAQMYPEWRFLSEHGVNIAGRTSGAAVGGLRGGPAPPARPERDGAYVGALTLPPSETEFRAGFYFCNSLIQLMEDVYLDLELENQWNHPDNRGWMNLFKHWSWVGTFRATWAVCAATYGRRFQRFCERHLGLELGQIEIKGPYPVRYAKKAQDLWNALSASNATPTEASVGRVVGALFAGGERIALNVLELSQILKYLLDGERRYQLTVPALRRYLQHDKRKYHLYQLELHVKRGEDDAASKSLLHFAFGYALTRGRTDIELFRVQDHLRKMGLARGALVELMKREPSLNIGALPDRFPDADFTERRTLVGLFRSVERAHEAPSDGAVDQTASGPSLRRK